MSKYRMLIAMPLRILASHEKIMTEIEDKKCNGTFLFLKGTFLYQSSYDIFILQLCRLLLFKRNLTLNRHCRCEAQSIALRGRDDQ
eukprot:Gb_23389 [translate_table: standard]